VDTIIKILEGIFDRSIPTILVIAGIAFLAYPYLIDIFSKREILEKRKRSATTWGVIFLLVGLGIGIIIKPTQPQAQSQPQFGLIIYPPGVNTPGLESSIPTVTSIVVGQEAEPVKQPTGINTPRSPEIVEQSTATFTPIPLPTPTLPAPTPLPTSTPKPVTNLISVSSKEENGIIVNIDTTGQYEVAYWGDAYSTWINEHQEGYRGWTNILRIYVNRPVEWGITDYGLPGPINQDAYLGTGNYYLDKNQAIDIAKGDSRYFRLNAGDYLTLVTLDEKGRYEDNQGKIDVGITYLGQ